MLYISFLWFPPSPSPCSISLQAYLQGHASVSQDCRQLPSLLMYAHIVVLGLSPGRWKLFGLFTGVNSPEGEIWWGKGAGIP